MMLFFFIFKRSCPVHILFGIVCSWTLNARQVAVLYIFCFLNFRFSFIFLHILNSSDFNRKSCGLELCAHENWVRQCWNMRFFVSFFKLHFIRTECVCVCVFSHLVTDEYKKNKISSTLPIRDCQSASFAHWYLVCFFLHSYCFLVCFCLVINFGYLFVCFVWFFYLVCVCVLSFIFCWFLFVGLM